MNPLIQLQRTTPAILVVLACFVLLPMAHALLPPPPPDGGYPGANTAEGDAALFNLTTGDSNTAVGFRALFSNTTGRENTAIGANTLVVNTTGYDNVACGFEALYHNSTGVQNTATGPFALFKNTTGQFNTANGVGALQENIGGTANTATGRLALLSNTNDNNTANGANALFFNTTGHDNTAVGLNALINNNTGSNNIALGVSAGSNLTNGSNNIDISALGMAGEANKIRIGRQGMQNGTFIAGISGVAVSGSQVVVNAMGKLGVVVSSARFKEQIKPMDKASEAILALKPVTFHYKKEVDPDGIPQFGLVAEQVEKVNPNLIARDADGKPYTVRYEAVNAMLLNEFLKEHRKNEQQEATIARQQKQIEALTAGLQKVSAQVEASKPAPQVVNNP